MSNGKQHTNIYLNLLPFDNADLVIFDRPVVDENFDGGPDGNDIGQASLGVVTRSGAG